MRASASRVYASTAAVPELTFKARMLVSETYQTNLIYFFYPDLSTVHTRSMRSRNGFS